MKSTARTSHLHPQISLITKNITKSNRSFVTKELRPDSSTLSNGKDTLLKKTLGYLKQSSPPPRNSSKTIKTPSATHTPQPHDKPLSCLNTISMSSPIPHAALPYIQFGTRIYTPNAAADALLDAALQDSRLASTLDRAIDPQSPVSFIREAYTHHMAMRNALISLVEHVPHHQEIRTLFTLLQ